MEVQPWLFIFCFFLPFVVSQDKIIYINLVPKDYINPRTAEGFICGVEKSLAQENLIAELNSHFIFDFMDKSEETHGYQSNVFDIVLFSQDDQPKLMLQCPLDETTGLLFVFVTPPKVQCNSGTYRDAKEAKKGYYPVFVGTSCREFRDVVEIFEQVANTLKLEYGGQMPKLCGSLSVMKFETANNRAKTMNLLFNFAFDKAGPSRTLDVTDWKMCDTAEQTENAIVLSEIFEIKFNIEFKEKKVDEEEEGSGMNPQGLDKSQEIVYVNESDGYVELVVVNKEPTCKKVVLMMETEFSSHSEFASADENDIVPYLGPAVFEANSKEMSIFVRIKEDTKNETDEYFAIRLKPLKQRIKRSGLRVVWEWFQGLVIRGTQLSTAPQLTTAPKPTTVFEVEQVINRPTLREWVTSLKTNLLGRPGQYQHFILVFIDLESIHPWELQDESFEKMSDEYLLKNQDEYIGIYETSTPSCDKTSTSLTNTYLKELTKLGTYWTNGAHIPWEEGLEFITDNLKEGKIVKVQMSIYGTTCGNHLFTMWNDGALLGIVHGWQDVFWAEIKEHDSMVNALEYLKTMLTPLLKDGLHDRHDSSIKPTPLQKVERTDGIDASLIAFQDFFGDTVNDVPMVIENYQTLKNFISEKKNLNHNHIFEIREIFTGYPSQTISSVAEGCVKSRIYQENYAKMPDTRQLCNEELRKYTKTVLKRSKTD
eukprot:GFUD01012794.1.p1 GENE.GFUD01012794.1~~GFUD01012794.1.p1  ORF type:complete len:708 (+),score=115.24 GFUD01012794.1:104-2227(+)